MLHPTQYRSFRRRKRYTKLSLLLFKFTDLSTIYYYITAKTVTRRLADKTIRNKQLSACLPVQIIQYSWNSIR